MRKHKYVVTTSLSSFKENFENWLSENPNLRDDKQLLALILDASENKNEIDAEKIAKQNHLTTRLEFRIADMLADGKCYITNQENAKIITTIRVQFYSYNCGPLCGDGGRRFFINDTLLLQTVEWLR